MMKLIKEADEKVKNNLKDFSEQEIREFIDSIDFDRMAEKLADDLGIKKVTIKVDPEFNVDDAVRNSRGTLYIHFESNNLIFKEGGIFIAVFSKVVVEDSGARLIVDNGKLYYFAPMRLTWEFDTYLGGGSAGADLLFKMYWDGLKWIVKYTR